MGFWEDQGTKKKSGKIENLKLESDKTYQVRLVGEPQEFTKLFIAGKSAVISKDSRLPDEYGTPATTRVAAVVIDRADGRVKLVESPASPYKPLIAWRKLKKRDPGGDNGCDLGIDVTGTGKDKRYTGVALDDTPLTDEEKAAVAAAGLDLSKLYKALSDEEAAARLFNKPAPTAPAPQRTNTATPPAAGGSVDVPF